MTNVTVGSWNILSHGLEDGGFISIDKDSHLWVNRRDRILSILRNMFENGCNIVVTQENDHFLWLLKGLQRHNEDIKGIWLPKLKNWTPNVGAHIYRDEYASRSRLCMRKKTDKNHPTFKLDNASEFALLYTDNDEARFRYSSDDGIGVYYIGNIEFSEEYCVLMDDDIWNYKVVVNKTLPSHKVFIGTYTNSELDKCKNNISIACAHLPDGNDSTGTSRIDEKIENHPESNENAKKRMMVLEYILSHQPDIIAMDSNCGKSYDFSTQFIDIYKADGYDDSVPEEGFECLKMRDMSGNQPSKMGKLIFDKIDRILYRTNKLNVILDCKECRVGGIYGRRTDQFTLYNLGMKYHIKTIRDQRVLEKLCLENQWRRNNYSDDDCYVELIRESTEDGDEFFVTVEHVFESLYPREGCPSDHPPVMTTFMLTDCRTVDQMPPPQEAVINQSGIGRLNKVKNYIKSWLSYIPT
jgi:hypothetical protein